jgi:predicted ATPase/tetratricopeptide (TPR) repeat protein
MEPSIIRTPDQRLRVFVSSTLRELADERTAVREAISQLHLAPVMFELGARPHPAINLYRAYLEQSHIFIGIYWQSYGWVAPDMQVSGLDDEYLFAREKPKLIYIKSPAPEREPGLNNLLNNIKNDDKVSYKYFSKAEELRQIVEDDLAVLLTERFEVSQIKLGPPAQRLQAIQHNLPYQITSFIGRQAEIRKVIELLEGEKVHLVTLTGPGGTGKTRLSLEIASRVLDQYKDGVFFVSLAEAHDPALVISKIAEVLDVREGGSQSLLENLKNYLRNKRMLLVLDNFEQVLVAAPLTTAMLESAPNLKMLVTSRALLNVRGEHEFEVPTLELPEPGVDKPMEALQDCESAKMFIDRVMAINPNFVLDQRSVRVISEICRRLDGLPLAIELAAARLKMLTPEVLLNMLNSRLKVLTSGNRDLPERQQTLRNTLEWSAQLLNQQDQKLFARLGVFMDGFSLEAVEEICYLPNDSKMEIFQGIESLLNNNLLQVDHRDVYQPRFKMLETIREFAEERLLEAGELEELKQRHARYFIDKMNQINPMLLTHEAEQALVWVDFERDNLRAAMARCLQDTALLHMAPFLLINMMAPWYRRGFLAEGRDFSNRLLSTPYAAENLLAHCYGLWCSGAMAMWQGDLNDALLKLEQAVTESKLLEQPLPIAIAQLFLGTTRVNRGEDKIAIRSLQEALELFKQLDLGWYQNVTLVHLANATLGMGNLTKARDYLDLALPNSERIGEPWLRSFILNNYGEIARTEGDYNNAKSYYEESEGLLRAMGDKGDLARLVHNLGCVAHHMGDLEAADKQFKESLAMFIKLGNQRGMAECLASLSGIWRERGQTLPAVKLLGAAQSLLDATGATWWPADRVEVERNLENLRMTLDQKQFEAAWVSGNKMKLETAIAYAQKGEDDKAEGRQ